MEALELKILEKLRKARAKRETNVNLKTIWKECGSVKPSDFARSWGVLEAGELVHGELFISAASIEGLGKITAKGLKNSS